MKIISTLIEDLYEIEPSVFEDGRGYFFESYNKLKFENLVGKEVNFVQDNQSFSNKDILRGLHLQKEPYAQGKFVRVIKGSVLDVAVDLRKNSKTFGKYHKVLLTGENKKMFWIPEGFAHGFLTLENNTIFSYKCTNFYNKNSEICINWKDSDINIEWEIENPILSEKDKLGISLEDYIKII